MSERFLPRHTVRIWWADLDDADESLVSLLNPVESERLSRTGDPDNRRRFLLGCAISRVALGGYLGIAPAEVPLHRRCARCGGPHGKVGLGSAPTPPGSPGGDPGSVAPGQICLSVTHGGRRVGVAFHRGAAVGLDVEPFSTAWSVPLLARRVLTARERARLDALPAERRHTGFLRYWTRKEAVVKALGVGLFPGVSGLEVSGPEEGPAVLSWERHPEWAPRTRLTDLDVGGAGADGGGPAGEAGPGAGYLASVAVLAPTPHRVSARDAGAALRAWAAARPEAGATGC
ncbi:4'-phosphopantetheinyl transferase superfamily protein [Streptomyces sp. AJS327]|uniref:4'-phosphopantetheinyl transferase family protein n=1 Tax=Streptomyces sp. AJS327 TaxID=2545265 RepID=UPI0015DE7114|nr:4'-phosphopantetheinyl transferase superfamily protein [Streptomyces sp. AJS327]MBA0050616.1 4'-phosphopantetheinyl transferase superfamily protein [Streptomyces sp. AJS327]